MADITNVNLLFQRKVRGVAPLSRYAVQDDGSLLVSAPDEMEVRTFHIVALDSKGRSQIRDTYNVETLRKTEISQSGKNFVGASDDHCYLFREARKTRFLSDRRASYTDLALGEDGQRFVVSYSDLLALGYSVALGDIGGRALWTKDITFVVRRVAVDRKMEYIAIAGDTGDLLLLDTARNTVLRHRQEAPLVALATNGPVRTVFAGGGGVGSVGADGQLLWFTEVMGDVLEVALDTQHQITAVLVRLGDAAGRLVLLSESGLPSWDMEYEDVRPTGLSLSANGRFVAVSLRDGSLALYELHYGERFAALDTEQVLAEARTARDTGNLPGAVLILQNRLEAVPADTAACRLLQDLLSEFRERVLAAAATAEAVGDFAEADNRLADYLAVDTVCESIVQARRLLRGRWCEAALQAGTSAQQAGDSTAAEARFREAIAAEPLRLEPRQALSGIRQHAADAALARGRTLTQQQKFEEAIEAFTEAQRRGIHGPEVTGLLRQARIGEAMALGNALYIDRQYAAALFQFKKVLRLDPEHQEAQQKVRYAQNFLQDNQLNERFTRLE